MTQNLFFKQNNDIPSEYVKSVILDLLNQIGIENYAVLGLKEVVMGPAQLNGMTGAGCIMRFFEPVDGCADIAVVLYCDYYQIASGNMAVNFDKTFFEVEKLYSDIDCFQLADVLGEIRGVKLPTRFEPEVTDGTTENGEFFVSVSGKRIANA